MISTLLKLAMLAKQSWRFITRLDSLCAQLLRAKYVPNGDLLKAGPKKVHYIPRKVSSLV
jgi:hypothetical protein